MRLLLDSSIIINFLRNKEKEVAFIASHSRDEIITSTICEAEVITGAFRGDPKNLTSHLSQIEKLFESFYDILSFDSQQAREAGEIKSYLLGLGKMIDDLDILIGVAAVVGEATLVTLNPKHFSRIKNLQIQSL